jgi:hypothetical protein
MKSYGLSIIPGAGDGKIPVSDANGLVVWTTATGSGAPVRGTSPTLATPTLTGDVSVSTGSIVIGTAGKGIDFSAAHSAATHDDLILDIYEKGTWTPNAYSQTHTTHYTQTCSGHYERIGDTVSCQAILDITNWGDGTGAMYVDGFPFSTHSATPGMWFEAAATGIMGSAVMYSGTTVSMFRYDYTSPANTGANQRIFYINITYRIS